MKKLLEFIVSGIIGDKNFSIGQSEDGGNLTINVESNLLGLIIGKEGKTIKAIRNILKIRAVLEKKVVFVGVNEENPEGSPS